MRDNMHILTLVKTGYVPDTCYLNSAISMTSIYKPKRPELYSRTFWFYKQQYQFLYFFCQIQVNCMLDFRIFEGYNKWT